MEEVKPFKILKLNECPHCYGNLILREEESYVADLDGYGQIVSGTGDESISASLICTACGEVYPVQKQGSHYMIARSKDLPEIHPIQKEYNPFYS